MPTTLSILPAAALAIQITTQALQVSQLRCENLVNPLGLANSAPRLSWQVESAGRGKMQSAFRILVSLSRDTLAKDIGDLWDSGKVASNSSTHIAYAGKPLMSHQQAFWKAQAWDENDTASPWSDVATWSMGFVGNDSWPGEWIGFDAPRNSLTSVSPLAGGRWIWHAADPQTPPKCSRAFLGTFTLPTDAKIASAELLVTADDSFQLAINARTIAKGGSWKVLYRADAHDFIRPGVNELRAIVENTSPSPAGLIVRVNVTLADGQSLEFSSGADWKSTSTDLAHWLSADTKDWQPVRVLGDFGIDPWGATTGALVLPPVRHLRRGFDIGKPVARAVLYCTSLGIHDAHLNGRRVSDDWFNPGWTDYTRRVYYRAYDVTSQLQVGPNAIGIALADGWYSGHIGWGSIRDHYGQNLRASLCLRLEFADGTTQTIVTDNRWKAGVGPTLESDFLKGEYYDANREITGWDAPGFDDSAWQPVDVGGAEVAPSIQPHPGPPVVAFDQINAKSLTEPTPGAYVFDLGQNFAGIARLKIKGKPGQKILLRFAERLNPDGTLYTANYRSARSHDVYICKGAGEETWQPRFTFHGFQYVELSGVDQRPPIDAITGIPLSSDTPKVGSFVCSDPMLNKLHSNGYWTQRANFIDIPTDCPQRDERLGWTGDAQVYIRTASLNTDVHAFFTKWLIDLDDAQRADGQYPMVAPLKVAGNDGGPAWAEAGVICPWTIYQVYGDKQILAQHYDAMKRYVDFLVPRSPNLLPPEKFHCFGDWLNIKAETPKDVIYEAYFAASAKIVAQTAAVLGRRDDAAKYEKLFADVKSAFNKAYVHPDGTIKGDTQCVYVLAIAYDLLDDNTGAGERLVKDIESRGGCLSTGFVGTKDILHALSKIGRDDVAYRLLHQTAFPSWGFSIKHGATSIWERWNGWTPEGFGDAGMNSFSHYAYGAVYQWMAEHIGGITPIEPGFGVIRIAPTLDPSLTFATTKYHSIRGNIVSHWKRDGKTVQYDFQIPANTRAEITLAADATSIGAQRGVEVVKTGNGSVTLRLGSGAYSFVVSE